MGVERVAMVVDSEDEFIEQVRSTAYRPDVDALRERLKQIQSGDRTTVIVL